MPLKPQDRIIVALDVSSADEARALVDRLSGRVGMFKIGSQLFTAAGPEFVGGLAARGEKIFLDLKYHDIPNTVAHAVASASRLGVSMVDVHALGGKAMMEAAVGAMPAMGVRLLAVTILTSHSEDSLEEVGVGGALPDSVRRLALLAQEAGVADRATFIQGDMYEADISKATVLALFLLPTNLEKLEPKFRALPAGNRIVVNTFGFPNWTADVTETLEENCTSWCTAMLYRLPPKVK